MWQLHCLYFAIFRLSSSDFPVYLLPEVEQPGSIAGCMQYKWCAVPEAAIVTVAMGDLQCSILARIFATDVKAGNEDIAMQLFTKVNRFRISCIVISYLYY